MDFDKFLHDNMGEGDDIPKEVMEQICPLLAAFEEKAEKMVKDHLRHVLLDVLLESGEIICALNDLKERYGITLLPFIEKVSVSQEIFYDPEGCEDKVEPRINLTSQDQMFLRMLKIKVPES